MSVVLDPCPPQWTRRDQLGAERLWASGLSVYAGILHLYVAPDHYEAWWGYGAFFVGVGVLQLAIGVAVLRCRSDAVATVAGLVTLALVVLYAVSRTRGIPVGPALGHPGTHRKPEALGVLDLGCAAAEVVTIALLAMLTGRRSRRILIDASFLLGVGLWCLRFLGQLDG